MPKGVRLKLSDLEGSRFGRLVVIGVGAKTVPSKISYWLCQCDCGNTTEVVTGRLINGYTRSCGCLARDAASINHRTHGRSHTPEFEVWRTVIQRCFNPNAHGYGGYGGRGIVMCERWRQSFVAFLADMGERPSPDHQLERIDNHGGYTPENCRWATIREQARNRRTNRVITHNGETLLLTEWSERLNINLATLHARLGPLGWSVERALSAPTMNRGRGSTKHSAPKPH